MRITAVETVRPSIQPNLVFVLLHTDDGRTGLGEAFFGGRTVESYLHESAAEVLLGALDPTPESMARALASYTGFAGAGVETRGNGAIDLALWDLVGQEAGLPLVRLFGGPVQESLPTYNTCAGPGYISTSTRQRSDNWGVPATTPARWDDLDAFLNRPAALARDLWDEGITGMKVWPFDHAAEAIGGTDISPAELSRGLAVLEAIREEVGFDMKLMVELHGLWNRRGATAILQALTEYQPYWVEDPMRPDAVDALAALKRDVDVPIATGETLVGRRGFLPLLERGAVDVVTVDVQWTGGLTEARKVAALADTYGVPVAPHDCTGPATLAACVHLIQSAPNGLIQETVRAFLRTWYAELVDGLPPIVDGRIAATEVPGHGVRLKPDVNAERRVSKLP
ncbi:mandelate racemase/muconate lactonizing enzyme family protein [Kribbella lupini]|uniref:Mandelate racemase/muconate lactonizing enzyme family protein n=1 Tax=Kribbella lupini TaxID=291602 RepID=A0ABN2A3D3_9ACTN